MFCAPKIVENNTPQHPSRMWQCWIIMQDVSLDCYLTCLTVTDLCSRVSFGLRWLSFVRSSGAGLRFEVRPGGLRLSSGLRLSRRLWWSLLLSSGGSVGAGWYVCSSIGSGSEVSIGTWGDVSIRTWRYDSIGAGRGVQAWRVVEQRAHGRACDWGGRRACHWAADHSHGLHGHLLGLRKKKMTHQIQNESSETDKQTQFQTEALPWWWPAGSRSPAVAGTKQPAGHLEEKHSKQDEGMENDVWWVFLSYFSSHLIQTSCYRCHRSNRRRHHASHRKDSHSCGCKNKKIKKHPHEQISVKFHTCLFYRTCSMRTVRSFQCEYLACVWVCVSTVWFFTDLLVEVGGRWIALAGATPLQLLQPPSTCWTNLQMILLPVRTTKHRL